MRRIRRTTAGLAALLTPLLWATPAVLLAFFPAPVARAEPVPVMVPERLTPQQLEELVAPIALYPDVVLESLLPATTTPLDVVAAARHVAAQGGQVAVTPAGVTWSPAVAALLQYPDVLDWMSDNLPWLETMGDAVRFQPEDVLLAIQTYRLKAQAAGVLVSNDYQRVIVVREPPEIVIVIEPVRPAIVYVPVYEPWPLLATTSYVDPTAFYRTWWGFSFGDAGWWTRHRISWRHADRGLYAYSDPWWGGRSYRDRTAGSLRRWEAPRRLYYTGVRRPTAPVVRPALPSDATVVAPDAGGAPRVRRRNVFVTPQGVSARDVLRRTVEPRIEPPRAERWPVDLRRDLRRDDRPRRTVETPRATPTPRVVLPPTRRVGPRQVLVPQEPPVVRVPRRVRVPAVIELPSDDLRTERRTRQDVEAQRIPFERPLRPLPPREEPRVLERRERAVPGVPRALPPPVVTPAPRSAAAEQRRERLRLRAEKEAREKAEKERGRR